MEWEEEGMGPERVWPERLRNVMRGGEMEDPQAWDQGSKLRDERRRDGARTPGSAEHEEIAGILHGLPQYAPFDGMES
ncbi:hypothetical protein GOP47_0001982 [Adiantum capillus-veneris]|uniref:Uncharacterized protein n=1 Tax=Adiantum capillus-veneris TaxID=13818 RepID=A0A9D4ZNS3_ADICA|nr:hypothetical protein GOP47_0001982 [Adiantum capillus-veneris]